MTGSSVADVPETTELTADQDILAGYTGDEQPTAPAPSAAGTPEASPTPPEPSPAPVAPPTTLTEQQIAEILAGVTKIHEIEATFSKKYDQTVGQLGRLQQMLTERTPTTATGRVPDIKDDDFKELKAEFPELSTPLLKELIPVLNKLRQPEPFDETRLVSLIQTQVLTERETIAKDLLTDQREDWETIVGPKDSDTPFRQWLAVQPLDYQKQVRETWRPGILVKAIEKFEAFQAATAPPESTGKDSTQTTTAGDRKARLEAAVAPKGKPAPVGGSAKSADEEMAAGYNSA